MFAKSIIVSSLVALALGKPVARRNFDQVINVAPTVSAIHPGQFNLGSVSGLTFSPQQFSFDNFGGLASLNGFDNFFGQGNFHGGLNQHLLVQQQVCQVSPVNIVQQHLAIVAEYAKQIILTQSCEVEAQTLLFTQWLAGLTSWGNDLRRINGIVPTFDSSIANQIVNVVKVDPITQIQSINTNDFGFFGSQIGGHAVTVLGHNWVNEHSPQNVGFVWNSAISAAGLSFPTFVPPSAVAFPGHSSGVVVTQKKA